MELVKTIKWEDLPSAVSKAGLSDGFVVGMFSDRLFTGKWIRVKDGLMKEHAEVQLECVRIFDKKHELKIFRTEKGFACRDSAGYTVLQDPDAPKSPGETAEDVNSADEKMFVVNSFFEKQLLDIDTKATSSLNEVYATGGGKYSLEGSGLHFNRLEGARVILEDYVCYYETGQAYVYDWRIVGFENGRGGDQV